MFITAAQWRPILLARSFQVRAPATYYRGTRIPIWVAPVLWASTRAPSAKKLRHKLPSRSRPRRGALHDDPEQAATTTGLSINHCPISWQFFTEWVRLAADCMAMAWMVDLRQELLLPLPIHPAGVICPARASGFATRLHRIACRPPGFYPAVERRHPLETQFLQRRRRQRGNLPTFAVGEDAPGGIG